LKLGKYELVRKLATGGMAEVFLAKARGPRGFEKTVVVKRILPHLAEDEQFVQMFLSEAQLAAKLNHARIVQIFDFGESDGAYFIAMEHVDGPNLRALAQLWADRHTPIPLPQVARMLSYACEGLAYAHEFWDPETGEWSRLIHRDISPDNILLARSGDLKLVDFGIAKAASQVHRTSTGLLKGKIAYMSPEQLSNRPLDLRADVYALGVVAYELISGTRPFAAESDIHLMQAIMYQPHIPIVERRPDVPEALQFVVDRALAKDRDERYESCREMQRDLEEYLRGVRHPVGSVELAVLIGGGGARVESARGKTPPHAPVAAMAKPPADTTGRAPTAVVPPNVEPTQVLPPSRPSSPARKIAESTETPPPPQPAVHTPPPPSSALIADSSNASKPQPAVHTPPPPSSALIADSSNASKPQPAVHTPSPPRRVSMVRGRWVLSAAAAGTLIATGVIASLIGADPGPQPVTSARASVAPSRAEPTPPKSPSLDHTTPGEDAPIRVAASPQPEAAPPSIPTTPPPPAPNHPGTQKPQGRGVNPSSGAGSRRPSPAKHLGSGATGKLILEALCSSRGQTVCGDQCVNLASDAAHCGACGQVCSSGEACVAGTCGLQCTAGFVDCDGQCVNLANNATHCGVCGRACSSGQGCVTGACRLQCARGLVECGGTCVDVMSDPRHCGSCGSKCPGFLGLGEGSCVKGSCQ
jgi:serine/threonine protein kinase